ncbi:hypothetical protein PV10_08613 [Exophiala mesophila]|uniref:O-methyltransferase C-terminal domain-containing protein n=1 Tax=Exophiala mesophila TaxID=212818 RepID=A0A0D1Z2K9_EXOME|nr:uncharacterized protein PV10_08613 [Exophiala mesophila]KIV88992.1 hypothetical protein PV10_08613 [Exophiala mesophila]
MSSLEVLSQAINAQAEVLSKAWQDPSLHDASSPPRITVPKLDAAGEEARNQLLTNLRRLEQMVLGPKDAMQSLYYKSAEAGVVQALCQLGVPKAVPLDGSISYHELSAKVNVSEDRLRHFIRIAALCCNYLAETETGQVTHSPNSSIWQLDPMMANGMEVMLSHLPISSFRLGDVCTTDPTDEAEKVDGFTLARGEPLFQYLESHPDQGQKFAAHMRAQAAQSGDEAIQQGYDWHSMKDKLLVDCGGSFGSVAQAIVKKEPGVRCIVQDLPKVINAANATVTKRPNFPNAQIRFMPHDFLESQPVLADMYLFRMVFHNWCDKGARRILEALRPVLRPGTRVVAIEYVMPPLGTAPPYAELATRRLDNVMYSLMKGKVRELQEFKDLFHSVEPALKFRSFKQGALKATHDPKCHSVLEWIYEPDDQVVVDSNSVETPPMPTTGLIIDTVDSPESTKRGDSSPATPVEENSGLGIEIKSEGNEIPVQIAEYESESPRYILPTN